MINFNTTEQLVEAVLSSYPFTRDSDQLLDSMIVQILGYGDCNYIEVMSNRKEYGIPAFATIERCRRKLQAVNENLRATKEVEKERFELQNDYERYALDKELM